MGGAACAAESLEQTPLAPLFCWVAVLGACACSVLFGLHALTEQSEATAALASSSLVSRTKQQERGLPLLFRRAFLTLFLKCYAPLLQRCAEGGGGRWGVCGGCDGRSCPACALRVAAGGV
ncbi:hypothetical protein TraAM80_08342 [Trypanosoma rangeli]|uniref:Transmembrane protein n=1 Tax=Trypanosoma rangeli TaxID=5698 RepID=A0A422N163_TRYRA|nr:uncharacterized protein TraAM80_08342 [Trypanosoma rangeli]RNE99179.1 hypothetical protein TraAM80_08342 [Trypanosoma rangeli]|eukprot:RNE99179.1 hypothetical protein TraAM80_08342 [Trypanosoma rangeli]